MRHILICCTILITLAGCSAGMVIAKRDTSETGRGTFQAYTKKLSIDFGAKSCTGHYASVRDRSEIGLISAYSHSGSATVSTTGTLQTSSSTGYAKGILTCNDGDIWRCEVKHDGPSGYGICVGKDGAIYDVITGFSL